MRTRMCDTTVPTTPEQQRADLPAWALEIEHPEGDARREIQAIRRASLSSSQSRTSSSPSVGSPRIVAGAAAGVGRLRTGLVEVGTLVMFSPLIPPSCPVSALEFRSWVLWKYKLPALVASAACRPCVWGDYHHSQNEPRGVVTQVVLYFQAAWCHSQREQLGCTHPKQSTRTSALAPFMFSCPAP